MPWIYESVYIHGAANVAQVTTAPGALIGIIVGLTVAGNIAVYDSASANENQVLAVPANAVTGYWPVGARISNGLRVTYPANCALTLIYK